MRWRLLLIKYKYGKTKGVQFKRKDIGDWDVKWNDLLAYGD